MATFVFWFLACFSSSIVNRAVLTIALGLGTMILPYAQNYFSHVTVAGVLFTAFVLIYLSKGPDAAHGRLARWLTDNPREGPFSPDSPWALRCCSNIPRPLSRSYLPYTQWFGFRGRHCPTSSWEQRPTSSAHGVQLLRVSQSFHPLVRQWK
jgi:hypothetical protein